MNVSHSHRGRLASGLDPRQAGSSVEVVAPSRLHFGMFSFGQQGVRQFGGVGLMVDGPGMHVRISPAERFAVQGPLAQRVEATIEHLRRVQDLATLPDCAIEVLSAPPEHVGLGTGTQLALSVTAGLHAWLGKVTLAPLPLAAVSGRAARSAIGTYGFLHGGLLIEEGKWPGQALSPLRQRIELPAAWRFVLIWPNDVRGLSGEAEQTAFREMPPVPVETTNRLRAEVVNELIPAAQHGDFGRFSESLFRFGYAAGLCFAERQAGAFATPEVARLVERLRESGVRGVGQSSWGPAVFALRPNEAEALQLREQLLEELGATHTIVVTRANQHGARITRQQA